MGRACVPGLGLLVVCTAATIVWLCKAEAPLNCRRFLVQASGLPLSVVIVGVGSCGFEQMQQLDDFADASKGQRDLVQFVPFRKYVQQPPLLARETLSEIPKQMQDYMRARGFVPNPPRQPDLSFIGTSAGGPPVASVAGAPPVAQLVRQHPQESWANVNTSAITHGVNAMSVRSATLARPAGPPPGPPPAHGGPPTGGPPAPYGGAPPGAPPGAPAGGAPPIGLPPGGPPGPYGGVPAGGAPPGGPPPVY